MKITFTKEYIQFPSSTGFVLFTAICIGMLFYAGLTYENIRYAIAFYLALILFFKFGLAITGWMGLRELYRALIYGALLAIDLFLYVHPNLKF